MEKMSDFLSSDRLSVIDLQIKTLTQEREILRLKDRISELEGRLPTPRGAPSYLVTNVASTGQIQLNVCDTAHSTAAPVGAWPLRTLSEPVSTFARDKDKKTVVKIETKKHADTFNFKQKDEWMDKLTDEVKDLPDELRRRNCLVKAVKENCEEITQNVCMQDGIFLDQLMSVRCLDDEERKLIADTRAQEANQLRAVIAVVVKKDFKTILSFVSCIQENNKNLSEKIIHSYMEIALPDSSHGQENRCWLCLLKSRVKIAVFLDKLFSKDFIDAHIYFEASKEDMSTEIHERVWKDLATQLASRDNGQETMETLRKSIVDCGVHSDIASSISLAIDRQYFHVQCTCGPQMLVLKSSAFEIDKDGDSGNNTLAQSAREIRCEGQVVNGEDLSSGFGAS